MESCKPAAARAAKSPGQGWSLAVNQGNWCHRHRSQRGSSYAALRRAKCPGPVHARSPTISLLSTLTPGQRSATPKAFAPWLIDLTCQSRPPQRRVHQCSKPSRTAWPPDAPFSPVPPPLLTLEKTSLRRRHRSPLYAPQNPHPPLPLQLQARHRLHLLAIRGTQSLSPIRLHFLPQLKKCPPRNKPSPITLTALASPTAAKNMDTMTAKWSALTTALLFYLREGTNFICRPTLKF